MSDLMNCGWKLFSSAPTDGREILVAYVNQNVYQLVSYNTLHKYWQCKGVPKIGIEHQGCVWTDLPRFPKEYRT